MVISADEGSFAKFQHTMTLKYPAGVTTTMGETTWSDLVVQGSVCVGTLIIGFVLLQFLPGIQT